MAQVDISAVGVLLEGGDFGKPVLDLLVLLLLMVLVGYVGVGGLGLVVVEVLCDELRLGDSRAVAYPENRVNYRKTFNTLLRPLCRLWNQL